MSLKPEAPPPLPEGWDLERVRAQSGDASARFLSPDERMVVLDSTPRLSEYIELNPVTIIDFSSLCLVRMDNDAAWYMGQVELDGSILCWGSYGDDLGEAIRAL